MYFKYKTKDNVTLVISNTNYKIRQYIVNASYQNCHKSGNSQISGAEMIFHCKRLMIALAAWIQYPSVTELTDRRTDTARRLVLRYA